MTIDHIDRRFESSPIFKMMAFHEQCAILPFSLSIVDCYFIRLAFVECGLRQDRVRIERISDGARQSDDLTIADAFDLYEAVREAEGREVLFREPSLGADIYLDEHERFVLIDAPASFRNVAQPYPEEIQRHRYIEAMLHLEDLEFPVAPEQIYSALRGRGREATLAGLLTRDTKSGANGV